MLRTCAEKLVLMQIVGAWGFILSAIVFMLECQDKWWKPAPLRIGWQVCCFALSWRWVDLRGAVSVRRLAFRRDVTLGS